MLASTPAIFFPSVPFAATSTPSRGALATNDFSSQLEDAHAALTGGPFGQVTQDKVASGSTCVAPACTSAANDEAANTSPVTQPVSEILVQELATAAMNQSTRKTVQDAGQNAVQPRKEAGRLTPRDTDSSQIVAQGMFQAFGYPVAGNSVPPGGETPDRSSQRSAATPAAPAISITRTGHVDPQAPMSFAAKVETPADDSPDPSPQHSNTDGSVIAESSTPKKVQPDERTAESGVTAAPVVSIASGSLSASMPNAYPANVPPAAPTQTRTEAPAVTAARETQPLAPPPAQASGAPLKDLSFNIGQPGGSSVQLRVVEHSGELRVAVHTTNPDLNQDLRADLPELSRKLSDTGVRAELWRPDVHSTASAGESSAARNQGDNARDNSPGNQGNSGGSQQGRGQRGQDQNQRPQWVEELEDGMQSANKSTGETYGFRN